MSVRRLLAVAFVAAAITLPHGSAVADTVTLNGGAGTVGQMLGGSSDTAYVLSYVISNRHTSPLTIWFSRTTGSNCTGTPETISVVHDVPVDGNVTYTAANGSYLFRSAAAASGSLLCLNWNTAATVTAQVSYEWGNELNDSCSYERTGLPEVTNDPTAECPRQVRHVSGERVNVDLDESDVGGGGGTSCPEDSPCSVTLASFGNDGSEAPGIALLLGVAFLVFVGTAQLVRTFRSSR